MLEIKRKVLTLEPEEILELERIYTDDDMEGGLEFIKKSIYKKLLSSQEAGLKSHLDVKSDPISAFQSKMNG